MRSHNKITFNAVHYTQFMVSWSLDACQLNWCDVKFLAASEDFTHSNALSVTYMQCGMVWYGIVEFT